MPHRGATTSCYGSAFAAAYDALMGDAAMPAMMAGLRQAIALHSVSTRRIADIGCGTGRVLAAFARPGRTLIGVDRSSAMIRAARVRLGQNARLRQRARLLVGDMRALALPHQVDLILCCFTTINYLQNEDDLARTAAGFARHLPRGGHLILDFIPRRADQAGAAPYQLRRRVTGPHGPSLWQVTIDPAAGRTETRIAFAGASGQPASIEHHRQQWHAPARLAARLRAAGLDTLAITPLGAGGPSDWLQLVARRG